MVKDLWKVTYTQVSSTETKERTRYAIASNEDEAIANAKAWTSKLTENKDFVASKVYMGDGEVYLWTVTGSTLNSTFSGYVGIGPTLVPGRTALEAELRAQAMYDNDASNFKATKVTEVQGYKVSLSEADSTVLGAALAMAGE